MSDIPINFWAVTRHLESLSRRNFLKISSMAVGVAAAGTGLIAPGSAMAGVPEGINHMSETDHAVFYHLMEVMFPVQGTSLVPPQTLPVMQTLDGALLAMMPPHVIEGLKGGLAYFNDAPKATFGKSFTELSDTEAGEFCDALANADEVPARALITALKFLVAVAYWAIPPTWTPLGFDGPVTEAWGLKYAGNAPLPQV